MNAFRICRQKYAATALQGIGSALVGGRWNSPGRYMVYAAEHPALAMLEMAVHFVDHDAPEDHVLLTLRLPEGASVQRLDAGSLPAGWRGYPASASLAEFGDAWLSAGQSLALRVPSAVLPQCDNVLLNPAHPEMKNVVVLRESPVVWDPRLF